MKKTHFLPLFVSGILISLSCEKTPGPISATSGIKIPKDLVPLAIGNKWTERITSYDTTGAVSHRDTMTLYILRDTMVGGVRWYLQGVNGPMFGKLGLRNDSRGLYYTNFEGNDFFYPYPAFKGEIFDPWFIESIDSIVTTPLGSVKCVVYRSVYRGITYRKIFAPGVGVVHEEVVGTTLGGFTSIFQVDDLIADSLVQPPDSIFVN